MSLMLQCYKEEFDNFVRLSYILDELVSWKRGYDFQSSGSQTVSGMIYDIDIICGLS